MLRFRIGFAWWLLALALLWASYARAACSTSQLTTEFQTNPANVVCLEGTTTGYTPLIASGNDAGVHECLNRIRKTPETGYRVWVGLIPTWTIVNQYDPAEYATVMADQIKANQLLGVTNAQQVDTTNTNVKTILSSVFPAGGPTRTNLTNIVRVDGSRFQVLCNNGVTGATATLDEVSAALTPLRP